MAVKRRIKVRPEEKEEGSWEDDLPDAPFPSRKDRDWKDWLVSSWAREWYFLGCLFADVMVGLEIWRRLQGDLSVVLPIIVIFGLIIGEIFLYVKLWGEEGRLVRR
ncbi:MAG TPA: hypothetical protein VGK23_03825 [Methanomassiliicoccales archaeon]|jgi:hypothetical protein